MIVYAPTGLAGVPVGSFLPDVARGPRAAYQLRSG